MPYTISPIKAFNDNYIWALHTHTSALVVDPGDAKPVLAFLSDNQLHLDYILITHHHFDHTGGIRELLNVYPEAKVYGPNNPNIIGITHALVENEVIDLASLKVTLKILQTPGHTLDHIVYVHEHFLFCGDTLFSGGCGRMFEGTPDVFYASLQKLANLPGQTKVYCTHEYTQANLAFALSIDTDNEALVTYSKWVNNMRSQGQITLPSTISQECAINPFLRCHSANIKNALLEGEQQNIASGNVRTFAQLRLLKDNF